MSKRSQRIALMEKLLTHLKNSKLEYLKAADHANLSEKKRFFNKQALLRNRFFQEVLSELQSLGLTYDDLIISRFNFDQLLISSIDTLKATALEKCLQADKMLLELYAEFFESQGKNEKFLLHVETLKTAVNKNQSLVADYSIKKDITSNF